MLSESIGRECCTVANLSKRRRADFLCRRVRRGELGVSLSPDSQQAAKQPVVLGVADQRIVEHMILIIVPIDFLPELGDFLCGAVVAWLNQP